MQQEKEIIMTDGIQITIGASGITGALANSAGLSANESKSVPKEIWGQVLQKVQQGVYYETPGARTWYEGHDKVIGGKLDYNPASKDFDGWNFKKGDTITINEEKMAEIQTLLRSNAYMALGSKDGNGDFELGEAVVAASPKTPKLKVSDREIAGLPVTPQMWQDLPQGKQITRVVNGQPQTIEITKDQDGNKVRYLVNEDGTRGEKLVAVAKFGKNAYQTESRYLAEHKAQQEAPADIASTPPEERMYRTKNGEV